MTAFYVDKLLKDYVVIKFLNLEPGERQFIACDHIVELMNYGFEENSTTVPPFICNMQ